MKKFFSLFMGIAIALSAAAAPSVVLKRDAKTPRKGVKTERKIAPVRKAKAEAATINIVANNLEFTIESYYGILEYGYVGGKTAEWAVNGSLYPEDDNYYTTYSSDNEDIELSLYDINGDEIELYVSAAELKNTDKGDQFTATGIDDDGNTYNINLTFFAPDVAKDTVDIDFGKVAFLKYYGETGDYYMRAENAQYMATLDIFTSELAGSFAKDQFDPTYTAMYTISGEDTVRISGLFNAKAEIKLQDDVYSIAAELFLSDSIYYRLKMSYDKPAYTDTTYINFANPVSIDNFGTDWYFRAENDNYIFQLDYYSNTIVGEFSQKEGALFEQYCGLSTINGTDTTYVEYNDLTAVITENATSYDIVVNYYGADNVLYIITATSEKPKADETVQVTVTGAELTDYSAYGMFQVDATSTDPAVRIVITLNSYSLSGSFTAADINTQYSAVVVGKNQYQIVDGELTSTVAADGSVTLVGWILAKNNVRYEFTLTTESTQGIENVVLTEKAQKVMVDGLMYISRDNKMYNVQGTQVR